jgi:SNF2 family DNA or RNA helicase
MDLATQTAAAPDWLSGIAMRSVNKNLLARPSTPEDLLPPNIEQVPLLTGADLLQVPALRRGLEVKVRPAHLLQERPLLRSLGKPDFEITTEGWKFPAPPAPPTSAPQPKEIAKPVISTPVPVWHEDKPEEETTKEEAEQPQKRTKLQPSPDAVLFKERLLMLLQPPLEQVFNGKQVKLPFQPFPYQMEGIAFLMPRYSALLADEMGLGKTAQTIISLRLMFHAGMIRRALLVCPKPLVPNWMRELKLWAEEVPFEVINGSIEARRFSWQVSNCPLKLVNYEVLTRDIDLIHQADLTYDVVVLDEAQRIKNSENKTSEAIRSLKRDRSWALTGTPIENRPEDLINIFSFVKPDHIPPGTPLKQLPEFTSNYVLRRVKEDVMKDMPPKLLRDADIELTPAQKETYEKAEKEGVIHLNDMGETITVQHVFELVMRLKQICNFDPRTGESAKLEQLLADMEEVAESNRKAIIFSQWIEPLEILAGHLERFGPLQYHGKIPAAERQGVLDAFKSDPTKHVILMSYGVGSVGLNLQFTNYVFLFDRWWNPAVEDQAINRAHRIGQKDKVIVTRFIAQNTIEKRINEVLEKKRQLFEELIGQNGKPSSMGLTEEEIFGLFDLHARPRRGG